MAVEYTAEIYLRSGLNAMNIPENKELLRDIASYHTVTGLTIRQDRFLTSIRVPLTYDTDELYDADYMIIYKTGTAMSSGFCYFVTGVSMLADDTAELYLTPDFLTTIGMDSLYILDGVTVRSTWALNNIPPYELDEGDAYIAPSGRMEVVSEWHDEGNTGHVLIESTIDIVGTANENEAVTCTDSGTTEKVTYPIPEYVDPSMYVDYKIEKGTTVPANLTFTPLKTFKSVGATLVNPNYIGTSSLADVRETIKLGLAKIRGLGLESAILHQYYLPAKYGASTQIVEVYTGGNILQQYYISEVTGYVFDEATGANGGPVQLVMDTDGSREAGVLNYSDFCKYGLMSASGDQVEADPKNLGEHTNPHVRILADPRPEGRPYFRFAYLNDDKSSDAQYHHNAPNFFRSAVPGLPWKQLPLVFTEASGNILNKLNYDSSRRVADTDKTNFVMGQTNQLALANQSMANAKWQAKANAGWSDVNSIFSHGHSAIASLLNPFMTGGENGGTLSGGSVAGAALSMGGLASSMIQNESNLNQTLANLQLAMDQTQSAADTAYDQYMNSYATTKLNEMLSYGLAQNAVVPTVMFPYETEALRDFCGNGVLVYRYWYSDYDKARIKKILRAYGAKYTMYTEPEHFQIEQGKAYAYIETSGVSIGDMPIWMANGAAAQLNNGVRIWNQSPYHIQ